MEQLRHSGRAGCSHNSPPAAQLWDWSSSGCRNDPRVLEGREPIPETFPDSCPAGISWLYGLGCFCEEAAGAALTQSPCAVTVKAIPATFPFAGDTSW